MAKQIAADEGGRSLVWLQGLACGALAALAPAAALRMALLLAPGIMALVFDRQPGRAIARTVLLCQLAACVEPVRQMWADGAGSGFMPDPASLGTAWSAAAAGWLLTQLLPLGVNVALDAASLTRSARLQAARGRLVEEWGLEPPADQ
jgi:hypothetical protein